MVKGKPENISQAFAKIRADYDMSRTSRFVRRRTGVNPQGSGPDYHYRNETQYYADIEQARDMDRNDSLVGTLADRRVDNIVQQGFTLDPKTGDKKLDLDLWQRWEDFSNDPDQCDIAGEMTVKEMERSLCRSESIDGDAIVLGTEDGSLQVLESHLIRTKSTTTGVFLGVEADQYGKRLRYHLVEEVDIYGQTRQRDPIDVRNSAGVRQLFHLYNPRRVNQTRGITQLAPIFGLSGMLEDINFAKLVQQQMVSMWAILHEYAPNGNDSSPPITDGGSDGMDQRTESTATGTRTVAGYSPGMEYFAEAGETLKGFSPNIPNSEYFQQVRLIMQILGVNFGLPLCLVLMDGSETNFSGWRGAVDEARKGFVADQLNLVRRFNKPAYIWKVNQWLANDPALRKVSQKSGINVLGHNWHPPTWTYIEPVADALGDAEQLKNALTSPRRLHAARGKDWEEVSEEIVSDNAFAIDMAAKRAAEFNANNPTSPQLTWRDLIPLPMPAGVTVAMQDPALVDAQTKAAEGEQATEQVGSGEFAGLSRQQWNRNRKAIEDILKEFAAGTTSEAKARIFLSGIGLSTANVDALILDASDGTVDAPELQEVAE
jgi:lambda family phage portal protein